MEAKTDPKLAAANRRENRALAKRAAEWKRRSREQREQDTARKMAARFFQQMPPTILLLDYRYWQLRRCGWDVLRSEWSVGMDGKECDPFASMAWVWWTRLHWKTRAKIVVLSRHRLTRKSVENTAE